MPLEYMFWNTVLLNVLVHHVADVLLIVWLVNLVFIAVIIVVFEQHLFLIDIVLVTRISFEFDMNLCEANKGKPFVCVQVNVSVNQ